MPHTESKENLKSAGLALELPDLDNVVYQGNRSGSRAELLASIALPSSWRGHDSDLMQVPPDFLVERATTTSGPPDIAAPCLSPGDVAVVAFNTYTPDMVALVALVDLPSGANIVLSGVPRPHESRPPQGMRQLHGLRPSRHPRRVRIEFGWAAGLGRGGNG